MENKIRVPRLKLTFTESARKGEKPIARHKGIVCYIPGLKTALPGETWKCKILDASPRSLMVMPVELVRTKDGNKAIMNRKFGELLAKFQVPDFSSISNY